MQKQGCKLFVFVHELFDVILNLNTGMGKRPGIRFRGDDVSGDGLCVIGSDSRVTTRQRKHPAGNGVSSLVIGGGLALLCCHRHYVDQSGAANHRGF